MAGSEAEERIRAKVVDLLRAQFGGYRIVHELVLEQGGVRLDVAAVGPDELVVVEIKSERDVLKRLADQVAKSRLVAQGVWVVVAPKHVPRITHMMRQTVYTDVYGPAERREWWNWTPELGARGVPFPAMRQIHSRNPDYLDGLTKCRVMTEGEDGALTVAVAGWWSQGGTRPWPRPGEMLKMLWADELRAILGRHRLAVDSRTDRTTAMLRVIEHMTGAEIRKAVCAALRAREFARADPPIIAGAPAVAGPVVAPDLFRAAGGA